MFSATCVLAPEPDVRGGRALTDLGGCLRLRPIESLAAVGPPRAAARMDILLAGEGAND
ncbi:MAG: hypothetical protein RL685_3149 [Pseudomonadota bacterium]|jgi:hypothetical protein